MRWKTKQIHVVSFGLVFGLVWFGLGRAGDGGGGGGVEFVGVSAA